MRRPNGAPFLSSYDGLVSRSFQFCVCLAGWLASADDKERLAADMDCKPPDIKPTVCQHKPAQRGKRTQIEPLARFLLWGCSHLASKLGKSNLSVIVIVIVIRSHVSEQIFAAGGRDGGGATGA
jgi:hypothetical protein